MAPRFFALRRRQCAHQVHHFCAHPMHTLAPRAHAVARTRGNSRAAPHRKKRATRRPAGRDNDHRRNNARNKRKLTIVTKERIVFSAESAGFGVEWPKSVVLVAVQLGSSDVAALRGRIAPRGRERVPNAAIAHCSARPGRRIGIAMLLCDESRHTVDTEISRLLSVERDDWSLTRTQRARLCALYAAGQSGWIRRARRARRRGCRGAKTCRTRRPAPATARRPLLRQRHHR